LAMPPSRLAHIHRTALALSQRAQEVIAGG